MAEEDTLIEFPCDFPIKVMGEQHAEFLTTVIALVQTRLPAFDDSRVETRISSGGRYISLTCTVYVTSKPQLDDLYRLLSQHPMIKVVL